jgi:aspartate/glutamate racemase
MAARILNDTTLVPTAVVDQINELQVSSARCLQEKGRLDHHLRGSRGKWQENGKILYREIKKKSQALDLIALSCNHNHIHSA